jgi:hypothetical protein
VGIRDSGSGNGGDRGRWRAGEHREKPDVFFVFLRDLRAFVVDVTGE